MHAMRPQFPARRAAEEFASVVDGTAGAGVAERYADLTGTVTLLREQPAPAPRAEFVADLRERLMLAADDVLLPVVDGATRPRHTTEPRRIGWGHRHLGAAAAAVVLVGSTAGLATAAQGSLPGDPLYPIKRGMESVEVHMTTSDAARGQEMLSQASTRLDEVRSLVNGSDDSRSVELINQTLDSFTSTADKGSELLFSDYQAKGTDSDIADVRDFTTSHIDLLRTLAKLSPPTASAAFSKAGSTLADLDQQARVLCASCSDKAAVTLPHALINLTSAHTLKQLVAAPTKRAAKLADLAQAAQQVADQQTAPSTPTQVTPPTTTPTQSAGGAVRSTGQSLGDKLSHASLPGQPVRNLVKGLTKVTQPLVGGLTTTVDNTLKGLTQPVQKIVQGLGNTVNQLLTPHQKSGTTQK
jgi:hypothetical protein